MVHRLFFVLVGLASILSLSASPAKALTLTVGDHQVCDVLVDGEILKGDFDVFLQQYSTTRFGSVCLNSPGGSYFDGIKIARFIDETRIKTRVRSNAQCFSACAIIFMAGITEVGDFEYRDRTLEPGGLLGFHAPYPVINEGIFDAKQMTESFAAAMAMAGDLVSFSGSYGSDANRPPGGKELSAIFPRPLLAAMLKKKMNEVYIIKTIGDAILAAVNLDTPVSSHKLTATEAINVAENYEFASTLGYSSWTKREWQDKFVKAHLGKRLGFIDREKGVVLPFYDGIFQYAYVISPGGCCGNNLNQDIFRVYAVDIDYDADDSTLDYTQAISGLLGATRPSLSDAWDSAKEKAINQDAALGWTPTWYRFSRDTEIASLGDHLGGSKSDPPTTAQDLNLHASNEMANQALQAIAGRNQYIVSAPGLRLIGASRIVAATRAKDDCLNACRADRACRGFQYDLTTSTCETFRDIWSSQVDGRFFSGAKTPNSIQQSTGPVYYSYIAADTLLGDSITVIDKARVDTAEDCERVCTTIHQCEAFSFYAPRGTREGSCSYYRGGQYFSRNLARPDQQPAKTGLKLQH